VQQSAGVPSPATLAYDVSGVPVRVRVEDPALVTPLRLLFPPYEVAARASTDSAMVIVRPSGSRWAVADGTATNFCETSTEVAEAVEFALTQVFLRMLRDAAHVHAAGVVLSGGGALLVGPEGAGKTSLAFWLSHNGHPVLGDDVALVAPGGRVRAFKRLFKVDPRQLAEAGVPIERTRLWEAGALAAWYDPADSGGWANESGIAHLAFLHRAPGPPRLRSVRRAEALQDLLGNMLSTGARGTAAFEILVDLVRGASALRIEFDSAAHGARLLEESLR
jgi:hypothetical protein